jgi:dolichyl-diphosphooligosaccharide--protein glycosyltransferase
MRIFAIFTSIIAIYVSSAFIRLELFASVGIIILGSIGLAILTQKIFEQNKQNLTKLIFPALIIMLFMIPLTLPENNTWLSWADFTPSILNGGSSFTNFSSNDWKDATLWIKQNTPEDAVIASWWDYGYWITTLSERTTLADNATLIDWQIKKMAYALITTPENSWNILSSDHTEDISSYLGNENVLKFGGVLESEFNEDYLETFGSPCTQIFKNEAQKLNVPEQSCNPVTKGMDADYLLIYLAGERFYSDNPNIPLYTLEGGGDESKKTWFAAISNHQVSKIIENDNITPTKFYMENSTLGMLTPFTIYKYVEPNTGRAFDQYQNGLIPVYYTDIKFNDSETDPFYLVYASPSFYNQQSGPMSAVLIYKINHDYNS